MERRRSGGSAAGFQPLLVIRLISGRSNAGARGAGAWRGGEAADGFGVAPPFGAPGALGAVERAAIHRDRGERIGALSRPTRDSAWVDCGLVLDSAFSDHAS